MAYLSIQDFKYGMDRRRERVAGTPGTLWTLENAHITRGGDIERCKKLVEVYSLPAGTRYVYSINRQLYVFGSADLAASMPLGVRYQRLQSPTGGALTAIVDICGFTGKLYVIADFDDGERFHFYNGVRVEDWDDLAAAGSDYTTLAQFMAERLSAIAAVSTKASDNVIEIRARVPGTAFSISGGHTDGGGTADETITVATPQPNVAAVSEVLATATITVTGGADGFVNSATLGAQDLIASPVQWSATNPATAIRLAQAINSRAAITGYSASALGAVVTISALPGTGATPNGTVLAVSTSGDIDVTASGTMAGGVAAVAAVAQISTVTFGGTYEAEDAFSVTINGTVSKATGRASGMGRSCNVFYKRVWSPANSLWRYSKLADASDWTDATAGFLNVAEDASGNLNLTIAERYQNFVAVYSEDNTVLYTLDTDPDNFAQYMVLDNTSTVAPGSVTRYGNNDVFHLDPTGVRSLRALNASNAPFVSDVGNAVDTFVLDYLDTLTEKQRRAAVSAIEPRDGRYLLAVGDRIFVLSFFPGAKISAWSYYSPGFEVEAFARVGRQLYLRAGDKIYLYGGADGQTYPDEGELPVTVELPFLSAGSPATKKGLDGFDAAFTNEWTVDALIDANNEGKEIHVGKIRNKTYQAGDISLPGQAPLVALKFYCDRGGRATISMAQIHFHKEDEG